MCGGFTFPFSGLVWFHESPRLGMTRQRVAGREMLDMTRNESSPRSLCALSSANLYDDAVSSSHRECPRSSLAPRPTYLGISKPTCPAYATCNVYRIPPLTTPPMYYPPRAQLPARLILTTLLTASRAYPAHRKTSPVASRQPRALSSSSASMLRCTRHAHQTPSRSTLSARCYAPALAAGVAQASRYGSSVHSRPERASVDVGRRLERW